jgi:hypothetical protein
MPTTYLGRCSAQIILLNQDGSSVTGIARGFSGNLAGRLGVERNGELELFGSEHVSVRPVPQRFIYVYESSSTSQMGVSLMCAFLNRCGAAKCSACTILMLVGCGFADAKAGMCPHSRKSLLSQRSLSCSRLFDTSVCAVRRISPDEVLTGDWMASAAMFVIGGGRDLGYQEEVQIVYGH